MNRRSLVPSVRPTEEKEASMEPLGIAEIVIDIETVCEINLKKAPFSKSLAVSAGRGCTILNLGGI